MKQVRNKGALCAVVVVCSLVMLLVRKARPQGIKHGRFVSNTPAASVLFQPWRVGNVEVASRVAMAPMTRGRAIIPGNVPSETSINYYRARAKGGAALIFAEASGISADATGWYRAPGIWSKEQAAVWKRVVDAVHEDGGKICMQLWHTGRTGHSALADGVQPISASPLPLKQPIHVGPTHKEKLPAEVPREVPAGEIPKIVDAYKKAAELSKEVGFDLVEVHGANGYLVDQFLQSCSNKRTDEYGGSVENRLRFMKEVVDACGKAIGKDSLGIRLSPNGAYNEMGSDDGLETFEEAIKHVGREKLAFIHIMDGLGFGYHEKYGPVTLEDTRKLLKEVGAEDVTIIGNVGYDKASATKQIEAGHADMIAFGRPFLNCPDYGNRMRDGSDDKLPETLPNSLWFFGDDKGYVDVPLEAAA